MTKCVYCDREIENNETAHFVGGEPMHEDCVHAYQHDMDEAFAKQDEATEPAFDEQD